VLTTYFGLGTIVTATDVNSDSYTRSSVGIFIELSVLYKNISCSLIGLHKIPEHYIHCWIVFVLRIRIIDFRYSFALFKKTRIVYSAESVDVPCVSCYTKTEFK
jgi:hypothetical protein